MHVKPCGTPTILLCFTTVYNVVKIKMSENHFQFLTFLFLCHNNYNCIRAQLLKAGQNKSVNQKL